MRIDRDDATNDADQRQRQLTREEKERDADADAKADTGQQPALAQRVGDKWNALASGG